MWLLNSGFIIEKGNTVSKLPISLSWELGWASISKYFYKTIWNFCQKLISEDCLLPELFHNDVDLPISPLMRGNESSTPGFI